MERGEDESTDTKQDAPMTTADNIDIICEKQITKNWDVVDAVDDIIESFNVSEVTDEDCENSTLKAENRPLSEDQVSKSSILECRNIGKANVSSNTCKQYRSQVKIK